MIPAILASVAGSVLSGVIQNAVGSGGASQSAPSSTLGKDDFLRLLTTQLRNQDPLNPMDNTAFVSQMAQFSSLEQMQNMNGTLQQLVSQTGGAGPASAASLLGRTITANGAGLQLEAGSSTTLAYVVPAGATSVGLQIQDATGATVRTLRLGQQGQGPHQATFDGLDDQGRSLPSGSYTFRVVPTNGTGQTLPGGYTGIGRVTGINVENGQLVLQVGEQRIPLASVVGVLADPAP
ncbi:MAG TPA: flagellar hook assembly protein FlgD [Candidatus Acidoferrum sp.]|nr:flagellar hook assembly protein FlgD [Candidatus Acidoferrum sp.]